MAKLPEIEEFAKKVSDLALDEFEYEGKTIREWTELILNGNLTEVVRCKDCVNGTVFVNKQGAEYVDCVLDDYSVRKPTDYCSYGKRKEGADNG